MNLNETNIMSKSFPLIAYKTNIKVEVNQKNHFKPSKTIFCCYYKQFLKFFLSSEDKKKVEDVETCTRKVVFPKEVVKSDYVQNKKLIKISRRVFIQALQLRKFLRTTLSKKSYENGDY